MSPLRSASRSTTTASLAGWSGRVTKRWPNWPSPLLGIRLRRGKLSDQAARVIAEEPDGAHPCWRERRVWLKFFEAARNSIAFGTAIRFG